MGMPLAFSPQADFSGMTRTRGGIQLMSVIHKAFVDVDEQGTEAAAAIGLTVGITSREVGKPQIFLADHLILFLIRDARTGLILFMGRLLKPLG
jgi:serpin B